MVASPSSLLSRFVLRTQESRIMTDLWIGVHSGISTGRLYGTKDSWSET